MAKKFEFKSYNANLKRRLLTFSYAIHFSDREPLEFTEKLVLPASPSLGGSQGRPKSPEKPVPPQLLENILQGLHLILGISYYKLYCPSEVKIPYQLAPEQAQFWNTVYQKGLGEFLFRNHLDPKKLANFLDYVAPARNDRDANRTILTNCPIEWPRKNRVLSFIGGGKDSIVATELLKEGNFDVTTLYIQTQKPNTQIQNLVKAIKLPHLTIERFLDEKIFQKHEGSYNGHIPVSAIFAFIGVLIGILYDYRYAIVSNERSSNFGNLNYRGLEINHQWSKSAEFEQMFQDYVRRYITPDVTYFSLLRHSNEIRIAKLFSKYPKYFKLFSSCNRVAKIAAAVIPAKAGIHGSRVTARDDKWCGSCPKCVFAFTILAPFIPRKKLIEIFGKDLFADKNLKQAFKDISGKGTMKPFDCVGTFEETQAALHLSYSNVLKNMRIKALVTDALRTYPAPLIPARFTFLGMEKALILGYGKEGKATKVYLKKHYPKLKIGIADKRQGKNYLEKQFGYDIAIKTPGIPKELVKIFYTTATNIFLAELSGSRVPVSRYGAGSARDDKPMIIGVTGSKGKSTTASLIYAILKAAKKNVILLGNIGTPMLTILDRPFRNFAKLRNGKTIVVLELSSYMLDDIQTSPRIAVVTNLFPEHMNYHGSLEKYYDAKKNIIKYQRKGDYFVYNPRANSLQERTHETMATSLPYQTKLPLKDSEIPLIGAHNRDNVRAAVTVARLLNISDDISAAAIRKFKGLAHRLEFVGEFKGIKFYDDAISTSPESTIEAVNSLPNIGTIFLGGEDRGYDFKNLEMTIAECRIKNVVLFPETGDRMFKNNKTLNILRTKSMKEAIRFAYRHTKPGEICLLSTASPSYSLWKDFIEKGNEFQKYVRLTGKKK